MRDVSYITSENILFVGSVLLISGVMMGKVSYRFGLPLLLVFLLVGMGFGIDGLGIYFEDMDETQFVGMVALCVILFSGGMETKYRIIQPVVAVGLVLSTVGVLLTALFTGLFVWWLSGMEWTNIHFALMPSLLLAATMSSTDSASVFGILGAQKVKLKEHLRPLLELESGSNDPMAYMLTIIIISSLQADAGGLTGMAMVREIAEQLCLQFVMGAAAGFGMGRLLPWLIKKYRGKPESVPEDDQTISMVSILALGGAFLTYAVANLIGGNGYLAVYLCGIVLGNSSVAYRRSIARFVGGMSWLAQVVMFLMLGLLVNPHEMVEVTLVSLLIGAFMIFVGRPASVLLCMLPFRKFSSRARIFAAWVGLRGAAPIIFATYPVVAGIEGSSQIFSIVFFVTLLSLLLQGTTLVGLSKRLQLTEEPELDESAFGVELAESNSNSLSTLVIEAKHLESGDTLKDMHLPKGQLVMMVQRNGQHIIPNGSLHLKTGDALLIIKDDTTNT